MITSLTIQTQMNQATGISRTVYLLVFLLMLCACQAEQTPSNHQLNQQKAIENTTQVDTGITTDNDSKFTILALGDSLTEGLGVKQDANYPALLQHALHQQGYKQIKVVNSGLSGETSSGLKSRLDWVLQLEPDLTILNIGANDAMRGLPLDLTTKNINEIIERIQASGSKVVLAGMQIYDNLGKEYVAGFKDMYPQIAQQHELKLIPFFLEHIAGKPEFNQADMIHPNNEGYQIIVDRNVLPILTPVLDQMIKTNIQTP